MVRDPRNLIRSLAPVGRVDNIGESEPWPTKPIGGLVEWHSADRSKHGKVDGRWGGLRRAFPPIGEGHSFWGRLKRLLPPVT
jgi:hypothetical protein